MATKKRSSRVRLRTNSLQPQNLAMTFRPEFTSDQSDPAPISGAGHSGIDSISIDPSLYESDSLAEQLMVAYRDRAIYGIISQAQYDAAYSFLKLVQAANSNEVIELEDGLVFVDEEREPSVVLASQPVLGSREGQRIYYLVAKPDFADDESLEIAFRDNVDAKREWQELELAMADALESPRDKPPVTFRVEDDYEDQERVVLMDEALHALQAQWIDQEEYDRINAALLFRDVFKREVGRNWVQEGNDGKYWRIYEFPQTQTNKETEAE